MISKATELRLVLLLGTLLAIVFLTWPEIDLMTSSMFYAGDGRWLYNNRMTLPGIAYDWTKILGRLLLAGMVLALFAGKLLKRFAPNARQTSIFLLVAALLGPGLLVDIGLKGQLGRARPVQTDVFGGQSSFTPAFVPSDQCASNCSFVSGHVAAASFIMAFGWLGSRRRRLAWLAGSLLTAGYVGWARIAVGGHFLSDVIFAWFAIYFTLWLSERILKYLGMLRPEQAKDSANSSP